MISVIIPTFNRLDTLKVVLPSIAEQTLSPNDYEILLCDSSSTDETAEFVKGLNISNLRHLVGENKGRSGARNLGIKEAKGDILMFNDADIIAHPKLLEEHLKIHNTTPKTAVIGREVQVDNIEEYERVKDNQLFQRHLHPNSRKTLPWLYFLTGNASLPKSIFLETGGFDEGFTGYGHEDLELGYRLQKNGIDILYNPNAINYHLHPVGYEEKCQKMYLAGISTVRFYNKHKDPQIKLKLGWNFVSIPLHSLIKKDGKLFKYLQKNQSNCNFCREITLQHYYIDGIKEGIITLGELK